MTAPDYIVRSRKIRTMGPSDVLTETANITDSLPSETGKGPGVDRVAVAVTDGVITGLGPASEIETLASSATFVIDVNGTIVPAFTDAHAHPIMSLSTARGADLSSARNLDEVAEALVGEADRVDAQGGEWVIGWGLDPNHFPGGMISNDFLTDALGTTRKAYVTMFDAHSAVASVGALHDAGITDGWSWPSGSTIVADAAGTPTGHLLEFEAMSTLQTRLPAQSLEERVEALHELLQGMATQGIGEVHVMDMNDPDILDLLAAAEAHAALPVKLRISPWCTPSMNDEECAELVTKQTWRGARWRVAGVKFFIDGTVEGGTAWLETPDSKGEGTESVWDGIEAYARRVRALNEAKVPTATHAIGERGIREVAETLAALPDRGVRHRIEHIESVAQGTIDLLGRAGIAASMQPTHCTHYTRADGTDDWSRRLGETRAARAWCIRDILDAGAVLALGSDFPVAPYPVLPIMADAQLRRPFEDPTTQPVLPEQSISAAEALAGFTTGPHAAISSDGGYIAVGKPASLTVLDVDPLAVDGETLGAGKVLLTMSDGVVTYRAN